MSKGKNFFLLKNILLTLLKMSVLITFHHIYSYCSEFSKDGYY